MEKTSNNFFNFSNLPPEIQREIVTYIDTSALTFFAMTQKQALENNLPLLMKHQAELSLPLTAGGRSTYCHRANQLFVCGNNAYGQLGLGHTENCSTFTMVPFPEKIKQVIAGREHTLVVTEDNQLWACGRNDCGQLGLGHTKPCNIFAAVPLPGKLNQVRAGGAHTLLITEDNQLWACGHNAYGQLGLGHQQERLTFTTVPFIGKINHIIAGEYYSLVLTDNNQLWVCGHNTYGQLGLGHNTRCLTLTAVPLPGKLKQVLAGMAHTLIVTEDNELWACGENDSGQLGLGHTNECNTLTAVPLPGNLKQVIAGSNHTFVITEDHQLWACGKNTECLNMTGKGNYAEDFCTLTAIPLPGKIKQVVSGSTYILVVTEDHRIWACGYNGDGQLGLGHTNYCHSLVPVKELPVAMHQIFSLNRTLSQLIKFGKALISSPLTNEFQEAENLTLELSRRKKRCLIS